MLRSGHDIAAENTISTKGNHAKYTISGNADMRGNNSSEERILPSLGGGDGDGIVRTTEVEITSSAPNNMHKDRNVWN